MKYTNIIGASTTPNSPIGPKSFNHHDVLYWLIIKVCFSAPSGPPIVKVVNNV